MTICDSRVRGLYAIADTSYLNAAQIAEAVEQALAGGACVIQYRDKVHDAKTREQHAVVLRQLCRTYGALFIVNDDVALAAQVDADGVHLGRDDMTPERARTTLGNQAIIGVSCYNDLSRARCAVAAGANYVAFGSFFPSRTKPQAVRAQIDLLRHAGAAVDAAIVAIGGITPENAVPLIDAGADSVAAIDGVFGQPDIRTAAARYTQLFAHLS